MKLRALISGIFLVCTSAVHAAPCDEFVAFGVPTTANTTPICHSSYAVHYDEECKAPRLVMEFLQAKNIGGAELRVSFRPDTKLSTKSRSLSSDYVKSGYDKGHLAPAADFSTDGDDMVEAFYMSNIVPQDPKLNRGQWKSLEMRIRALALKYKSVFVYTGVIFGPEKIGSGVCVPTHLYKVVINTQDLGSIAYLIPNAPGKGRFQNYAISLAELEALTKINYVPKLVDPYAAHVKNTKSLTLQGK